MRRGLFILTLSAAFLSLACGLIAAPKPTPTSTGTQPSTPTSTVTPQPQPMVTPTEPPTADWQRYETEKFEIWLPRTWERFPLEREALESMADMWEATNPRMAEYIDLFLQAGLDEQIDFWAMDTESTRFVSNVNILSLPMLLSPASYVTSMSSELEGTGATIISTADYLEINGLATGRIDYRMPMELPGSGMMGAMGVQYAVSGDSNTYVLTFTTAGEQINEMAPIFEMSANSFRVFER